jgi:hypothetical protein
MLERLTGDRGRYEDRRCLCARTLGAYRRRMRRRQQPGLVSIEEAADLYSNGTETMRIEGALVIEYGQPQLCSGVVRDFDPGTPICESPAYWIRFGTALPDVNLEGDGNAQWAEDVSFHGTLDEGVFTVDG